MLRGPVQMLGITVPRIAVGLAAVPPQPRADDAEGIDPAIGRTGSGIEHRGEHLFTALLCAGSGCRQQARGQCRCRPGRRQAVLRRGAGTRGGWDRAPGRWSSATVTEVWGARATGTMARAPRDHGADRAAGWGWVIGIVPKALWVPWRPAVMAKT